MFAFQEQSRAPNKSNLSINKQGRKGTNLAGTPLTEISLRESAHGFESHSLRHLRGWKQHSSPVFSRTIMRGVI